MAETKEKSVAEELKERLSFVKRGPLYERLYWEAVDRLMNPPLRDDKVVSEYDPFSKERMEP